MSSPQIRQGRLARLAIALAAMAFFPASLLIDLYIVPWSIPTTILYAVPVIVAARFLAERETVIVLVGAVFMEILDGWLEQAALGTHALALLSLMAIGLLVILWARSERKLARLAQENAELFRAQLARADELEESHKRLQEFFGVVSHDLKSPLTAIVGNAQLLTRSTRLDEDARSKMVEGIIREAKRIKRLADDLADAAQVGAGHLSIEKTICDLVSLAEHVVSQHQLTTEIHKLTLQCLSGDVVGHWDCDRLSQVLANLVGNAIKYSPEGGEVRLRLEARDGEVLVSVSDQGAGISQQDIPALFAPYSRVYRKGGIRGTGLGLYITKGIVEAHGGRILVESRVGEGSTFTVILPLSAPPIQPRTG
ncbi:MAG: HAMP domain-containing histidine kinase [Chloroflexota bacterium]|nr:MAG: HAMP domain-containing histidine kinase [Chloroflexota bacterium]